MKEQLLHVEDEAFLGPVAVAMFVDMGWLVGWPLAITRYGLRAIRNGYGRDELPIASTCNGERNDDGPLRKYRERPGGAFHWPGRSPFPRRQHA